MPVQVSEEIADRNVREVWKKRKVDMIRDLGDLADNLQTAAEYVNSAVAVCVRPTHPLKGDGVAQLIDIAEKITNYVYSANMIIQDLRTGKAKI